MRSKYLKLCYFEQYKSMDGVSNLLTFFCLSYFEEISTVQRKKLNPMFNIQKGYIVCVKETKMVI